MPKVESSRRKTKNKQTFVPYVKGFRRVTSTQQITALGYGQESEIPPELQSNGFEPIKRCTSIDDWLAQYQEPAQSFTEFLSQTPWLSRRKLKFMSQDFVAEGKTLPEKYPEGKIYIVPLGDFDDESAKRLDALIEYTEIFLGLPVRKLPTLQLDVTGQNIYFAHSKQANGQTAQAPKRDLLKSRFKKQKGFKHHQLCIGDGLLCLKKYLPSDGLCMIALTNQDLYEAKSDLFVAGMAAGNQRVAIFSLFRYNPNLEFSQEFWYDIRKRKRYNAEECSRLILQRGCRLLVHEISHLLGLGHCVYYDCCMNGSGHLEEDFSQPMHLCPVDLRKLQALVGFSIRTRYRKLEEFYKDHDMREEAEWVKTKMDYIHNSSSLA